MVITGPTDIIRRMGITGTSVVPGGRGAGGSLGTTGIIGQIDMDHMDTTDSFVVGGMTGDFSRITNLALAFGDARQRSR